MVLIIIHSTTRSDAIITIGCSPIIVSQNPVGSGYFVESHNYFADLTDRSGTKESMNEDVSNSILKKIFQDPRVFKAFGILNRFKTNRGELK